MRAWKQTLVVAAVLGGISAGAAPALGLQIYGWQATFTSSTFSSSLVEWRNPPTLGTVDIGDTSGAKLSFVPAFSPSGVLWGTDGGTVFHYRPRGWDSWVPSYHHQPCLLPQRVPGRRHVLAVGNDVLLEPEQRLYLRPLHHQPSRGNGGDCEPRSGETASLQYDLRSQRQPIRQRRKLSCSASTPPTVLWFRRLGTFPAFITSLGWGHRRPCPARALSPPGVLIRLAPTCTRSTRPMRPSRSSERAMRESTASRRSQHREFWDRWGWPWLRCGVRRR